jgi:hypothetical protein
MFASPGDVEPAIRLYLNRQVRCAIPTRRLACAPLQQLVDYSEHGSDDEVIATACDGRANLAQQVVCDAFF